MFFASGMQYGFENRWGGYASNFDFVARDGNQTFAGIWPIFMFVLSLIIGGIILSSSKPDKNIDGTDKERTSLQKAVNILGIVLMINAFFSL